MSVWATLTSAELQLPTAFEYLRAYDGYGYTSVFADYHAVTTATGVACRPKRHVQDDGREAPLTQEHARGPKVMRPTRAIAAVRRVAHRPRSCLRP